MLRTLKIIPPTGTQIRYTENGVPVILGHTAMEDFAALPEQYQDQPTRWKKFDSSCHTCHAAASIHPDGTYFQPFPVVTGKLTPSTTNNYLQPSGGQECNERQLGDGYVPLDFLWAIPFQAKSGSSNCYAIEK